MINTDTIKLLRECDAGVKMGIESIDDVLVDCESEKLRDILQKSKEDHDRIGEKIEQYLQEYHDDGKEPAAIATIMARMKSGMKMRGDYPDQSAAELITDGCNMGIRSIYKYLNQYNEASQEVKQVVYDIVKEEEGLQQKLRQFL